MKIVTRGYCSENTIITRGYTGRIFVVIGEILYFSSNIIKELLFSSRIGGK